MVAVVRSILTAAIIAGLILLPSTSAQANTDPLSAAGRKGLEQISTCLRSNPNLVALLVVDESGSLAGTDPEGRRAEVLANFVDSLADLSGQETPDGPRRVEFAVNLFAQESNPYIPWVTLDPENAADIATRMQQELPFRNEGGGTNYEAAMETAASTMAEGVARVGSKSVPCQIVVWFTDGLLEISSSENVNQESAERLCAASGPIDVLRFNGIHLISVLLFDRSRLEGQPDDVVEPFLRGIPLLQASAEGTGGSGRYETECGTVPIPNDAVQGAFFEGTLDALSGQFTQAIAIGSGGTLIPNVTQGTPTEFTIDPGFSGFWINAQAPDGFELTGPQGPPLSLRPGEPGGPVSGTQAEVTWVGPNFTAKIPITNSDSGDWVLTRPQTSDIPSIYLFSDYSLAIEPTDLVADELSTVTGQVLDGQGNPADLTVFSEQTLAVSQRVDGQDVDPIAFELDPASGTFTGSFVPQSTTTQIAFDLTLSLVSQSGIALTPLTTSFTQQVKLPGAYPQVTADSIDLGALQNRGDVASTVIQLQGSADGPTRVCTDAARLITTVADADLAVTTNPSDGCIDLPPNGTATIEISATLGNAVVDGGQVRGEVQLRLVNAPTAELPDTRERDLAIPFTAQVLPVGPVLWVPFALTALGVLLPLVALYVMNWSAAKLRLSGTMMARVPVTVDLTSGGPIRRTDGQTTSIVSPDDFQFVAAPAKARTWTLGREVLKARAPVSPFGSVRGEVVAPEGFVVASNETPVSTKSGRTAGVGLNPSTSAYLLVSDADLSPGAESVNAELVTYLTPTNLLNEVERHNAKLSGFLGWSSALRELSQQTRKQTPADDGSTPPEAPPPPTDAWDIPRSTGNTTPGDNDPKPDRPNRFQL